MPWTPPAYDIYAEQLRVLHKGHPLYYPDPHPTSGPVEIGDVGYVREGAFYLLFNATRSASEQGYQVPKGFVPLGVGSNATRLFKGDLRPGSYPSKTMSTVKIDVGIAGGPTNTGVRYVCNSSRGAILELEAPTDRELVHSLIPFKLYAKHHCLSWYEYADQCGVEVTFGDIILVTEWSKTAAWASAVYTDSSREVGISFQAGAGFVPSITGTATILGGVQTIGPVLCRMSERGGETAPEALNQLPKTQTVFIKGCRPGPRELYYMSIVARIMQKMMGKKYSDHATRPSGEGSGGSTHGGGSGAGNSPASTFSPTGRTHANLQATESIMGSAFSPEIPDFQPAVALLAYLMETTDEETAVIHDDDWCEPNNEENNRIVNEYASYFLDAEMVPHEMDIDVADVPLERTHEFSEPDLAITTGDVDADPPRSTTAPRLPDLPYDVLQQILCLLSPLSVFYCSLTHPSLNTMIKEHPVTLRNLGSFFLNRYEHTAEIGDLDKAIQHYQQAVMFILDHPERPGLFHLLGMSLFRRFERMGHSDDLEEAIQNLDAAVLITPDGHPEKPAWLDNLVNSIRCRYQRMGMLSDLDKAINIAHLAVSLTPDGHPDKPALLNNFGTLSHAWFERTGDLRKLEELIENSQQAVMLSPYGHPNMPMLLNNLGMAFYYWSDRTGSLSGLEEAIKNHQHAVSLIPDEHPDKPLLLGNLGMSLLRRSERKDALDDNDEAIRFLQQAMELSPDGHLNKLTQFKNLGRAYRHRFERTGFLSDLDKAVEILHQAVMHTPVGHPERPQLLDSLGMSLRRRFERTVELGDIDEAIKNQQQALLLAPDGHPDKPSLFSNLGMSLLSRFECTGVRSDLLEAVRRHQEAVLLTPDGHLDKPSRLSNLGISFLRRFECMGDFADLEEAINTHKGAVSITPDGHPDKLRWLSNLGTSYESRFKRTREVHDLDTAISLFQSVALHKSGPVSVRARAAQRWASLAVRARPREIALEAYGRTIELRSQMVWIGNPVTTGCMHLADFGDLPREAATCAIRANHPRLALEWLEQGRSVIWNQLLNLRSPVDDLHQAHPSLSAEFIRVYRQLEAGAARMDQPFGVNISLEEETQDHHRLAERFDSILEEVRSLPGFEDFLLPKKVSELKKAADSGPVVVINVHHTRCDALVLEKGEDDVHHIPLRDISYKALLRMQRSLKADLGKQSLGGILSELYAKIVHPILQVVHLATQVESSDGVYRPRIWWCPTGPLTSLPLHAALRGGANVHNVVSSYTPTVNALLHARAVKRPPFKQLLGVAVTNTPGLSPLPYAEKELEMIRTLFSADPKGRFKALQDEQATVEQVLEDMANSSWVHLACHAGQNGQKPMESGLSMHDRQLTIRDLVRQGFGSVDLAFLSASETATGEETLSDEAIHITGAMLAAGCRSVIGTMGTISDEAAVMIAKRFYENVLVSGEPNSEFAAQALDEAVEEMRKSSNSPYLWVPFVHYGV